MNLSKEEKKILIDLICHRQTRMIVKHPEIYASDEYKKLEALKVKIKDEKDYIYETSENVAHMPGASQKFLQECSRVRDKYKKGRN